MRLPSQSGLGVAAALCNAPAPSGLLDFALLSLLVVPSFGPPAFGPRCCPACLRVCLLMATALSESGLEEGEYDSDSDGTSALALRRRQASDDEDRELPLHAVSSADDDDEDDADASPHSFSDEEVDGVGTPPDGEDEAGAALPRRRRLVSDEDDDHEGLHQEDGSRKSADPDDGPQDIAAAGAPDGVEPADEEKKEAEPFVVPTAGAFYMHDDRFRGVAGARPR